MGVIQHDAILVTGYIPHMEPVYYKAQEIFTSVGISNMSATMQNGYMSFCIWPDGSKEDLQTDKEMDAKRAAFIDWLEEAHPLINWIHVSYGEMGEVCGHEYSIQSEREAWLNKFHNPIPGRIESPMLVAINQEGLKPENE